MAGSTIERLAVRRLARRGWLLVPVFAIPASTLVFAAASGDWVLFRWCLLLTMHGAVGLWLSFAIHEAAHLAMLSKVKGVAAQVDFKLLRVSVVPYGTMSGWQIVCVALLGPLVCVAIGIGLALAVPDLQLQWWYLGHAVFLLPVFGDGRSLIKGLVSRGRLVRVP